MSLNKGRDKRENKTFYVVFENNYENSLNIVMQITKVYSLL